MKVFIGTTDITSRIRDLTRELHRRGIETLTAKRGHSPKEISPTDFVYDRDRHDRWCQRLPRPARLLVSKSPFGFERRLLDRAIAECDLFVFLWSSIYADRSDYRLLHAAGKPIVTLFVGSDIRSQAAAAIEFEAAGITFPNPQDNPRQFARRIAYADLAERYSEAIFSRPDQSQLLRRPYHRMVPAIDPADVTAKVPGRRRPLVVCGSSSNPIKGGAAIEVAIAQLRSERVAFDFRRIAGVDQFEARQILTDADIAIDQLVLPGGGKLTVEAMAAGCVNCTLMGFDRYPQLYPERPPVVDVSAATLTERLRELIQDRDRRVALAEQGPGFVAQHAAIGPFVDRILGSAGFGKTWLDPDCIPTFLQRPELTGQMPPRYRRMLRSHMTAVAN